MYNLIPTPNFARQFKKLDKFTQKKIKSYLENILEILEAGEKCCKPIEVANGGIE